MPPVQEGPAEEEDAITERLPSAPQSPCCHFWLKVAGAATLAERTAQASALVQTRLERTGLKPGVVKEYRVVAQGVSLGRLRSRP